VLLGLGGLEMSREHAADTGKVLTEMQPDYASALTLMLLPNTSLYRDMQEGKFTLPDRFELLAELREMINQFSAERPCLFTSNHASNYLPLKAELPAEKESLLKLLDKVLESKDESVLKPEYLRAL
jgi:coproporphyrinogen III oxidase-like Fe-S oxidoreductase